MVAASDRGITLHGVVRDALHDELGEPGLARVNGLFLDAMAADLPRWWDMDPGEPYLWDHLLGHLVAAGRRPAAADVAADVRWICARLLRSGPAAPIADLSVAGTAGTSRLAAVLAGQARLLVPTSPAEAVADIVCDRIAAAPGCEGFRARARAAHPTPRLERRGKISGRATRVAAPDGSWLASVRGQNGTIQLWDIAAMSERAVWRNGRDVRAVAAAPDRGWLVTGGDDGVVRIWDLGSQQETAALAGQPGRVEALVIAPDASWIAVGHRGREGLQIWDPDTGDCRAVAAICPWWSIAASDDWLASWDAWRASLQLVEVATGRVRFTSRRRFRHLRNLHVGPGGRWLAVAFTNGRIQIYEADTGHVQARLKGGYPGIGVVRAMAAAPDGRWLAAPAPKGTVRVWDPATGKDLATLSADDPAQPPAGRSGSYYDHMVRAVAVSPDGAWLAAASGSGAIRVWETATWRPYAMTRVEDRVEDCFWLGTSRLAVEAGDGVTVLDFNAAPEPAAFAGPDPSAQADAAGSGFVLGRREGAVAATLAAMSVPIGLIALGLIVAAASIPVARLSPGISRSVQSDITSVGGIIALIASVLGILGAFYLLRRMRRRQAERAKWVEAILVGVIPFWTGLALIVVSDATLHAIVVAGLGGAVACIGISRLGERFEGIATLIIPLLIVPFGLYFAVAGVRTFASHGSAQDGITDLVIAITVIFFAVRHLSD
jgi:hypothetical protein